MFLAVSKVMCGVFLSLFDPEKKDNIDPTCTIGFDFQADHTLILSDLWYVIRDSFCTRATFVFLLMI